ncbi:8245_t:CDS:2, partial [Cetraspora pellucida]
MNTPVISSWSVYHGPAGDFDDMAAPPSRFLNVCGDFAMTPSFGTFGQDLNIFDDGVQKLSQSETMVCHETQKKDDYYVNAAHFDSLAPNNPILIVNNSTATIPAPSPIVTSYSPHTSNLRENPLMTAPTIVSIHSPTPSLVTDDDQDHHHQEALCRDIQKNAQNELVFQSRSPRIVQNHLKNDQNGLNGQEPLKHPSPNDVYGNSTKKLGGHLSPVKSVKPDDANAIDELNSTQPTPPPSHQTTPTQKKRRVNKKTAVNNITAVQNTTNNTLTSPIEESTMSQLHNASNVSFSSSTRTASINGNKKRAAEDAEETAEEKRRKFLERNRIAAWVQDLKNKADSIIAKNNQLHAFVNDLKEEMLALKNQLLAHRNCDCNILQEYIKN